MNLQSFLLASSPSKPTLHLLQCDWGGELGEGIAAEKNA